MSSVIRISIIYNEHKYTASVMKCYSTHIICTIHAIYIVRLEEYVRGFYPYTDKLVYDHVFPRLESWSDQKTHALVYSLIYYI